MKKIICSMLALLLCSSALPVSAAYESADEFTMNLRAMSGGYIPGENINKIYVSPEDAQNGTSLHFGVYLEAERPDLVILTVHMNSGSENITFDKSAFQSPSNYAYSEAQTFVLPDGTEFSTRFKPYSLGVINSMGNYVAGGSSLPYITDQLFTMQWMYSYSDTSSRSAAFLGNDSDWFSFIEFDVQIAPGTEPGVYTIDFVTNEEHPDQATSVSSDVSIDDPDNEGKVLTRYSDIIPTLKPAEIVIAEKPPVLETEIQPCFRFAEDTEEFKIQDFPENISISYGGDSMTFASSALLETFEAGSPSELYITEPVTLRSELSLSGMEIQNSEGSQAALEYHIGLKGDANLDGKIDSKDAAQILRYAAAKGSGERVSLTDQSGTATEQLAYFLADIDGESRNEGQDGSLLNSLDAAKILKYVTMSASGQSPDWNDFKN